MINPALIFGRLGNSMFQYAALYALAKENNTDFFFQDEKWFKKYEDEIRTLFSQGIEPLDYVAVHVRRGKNPINPNEPAYAKNPFYVNLCNTDYYERAMSMFPDEEFLVFSDDIEWCKDQEIFKDCTFSEGKTELEDLNLMASCKHNIMANSSFSWWAAWLNPNKDKKVIYPSAWYADGVQRTVCPPEWKAL